MKVELTITVDANDLIFALLHRMDSISFVPSKEIYEIIRNNKFLMNNLVSIAKDTILDVVKNQLDEYDSLTEFAQKVESKCQDLNDLKTINSLE